MIDPVYGAPPYSGRMDSHKYEVCGYRYKSRNRALEELIINYVTSWRQFTNSRRFLKWLEYEEELAEMIVEKWGDEIGPSERTSVNELSHFIRVNKHNLWMAL